MGTDLSAAMAALTAGVTRVRVIEGGVADGRALGRVVLAELDGEDVVGVLAGLAVAQPAASVHCMCLGDPAIELWVGDRRRATIGVHHGISVRVHGWWSDAPLRDGEALLLRLAERGVTRPLAELLADRERRSEGERRRAAWLAAAPAGLRARLPGLEGAGRMLPRFLKVGDADAREAVDAVVAELGEGAAAGLLAWFGGPGGPWSGYPAYESVAEVLLACLPIEGLIAAASADEGVVLGLARFVARHGAPPRERRLVGEALRGRMFGLVGRRGDADMRARLAAALATERPACDGVCVGEAMFATGMAGPVACGGSWATLDGDRVVRFDPGGVGGVVRAVLPGGSATIGAVGAELVVAIADAGEVWRVPAFEGEARVIARGQARPMEPCGIVVGEATEFDPRRADGRRVAGSGDRGEGRAGAGGVWRAAWLEQVALPQHRTATRVRVEGMVEAVAEHADNAWDLLACDGALWWARHGGSLWSTLFGKNIHRVDLMRWAPGRRRAEEVAVLEGGDDGTSWPRLFSDGRRIAWTSGRRIGVIDPRRAGRRWFEVDAEVLSVWPLEDGVIVALARDRVGELVRVTDGGRTVMARWSRAPWERERIAVRGGRVVWNAGEWLWAVEG